MPQSQQLIAIAWALFAGFGFFAIIYFTVSSAWFRKAGNDVVPDQDVYPEADEPVHRFHEGLEEAHGKVPFILRAIIVGYILFLAFYVVYFVRALNGPLGVLDKFLTK